MGKELIILCGPTASGKSAVAMALCEQIGGELVSCDSMQLYRGMDIGTAKPTLTDRQRVPHHMIDVLDPEEKCSAAKYRELATPVIEGIFGRGKTPVLCGGTGLYINALTKPLGFSVESDPSLRARLTERGQTPEGKQALHDALCAVDPESAQRLHTNDVRRVIRALEVHQLSGKTLSEQMRIDAGRLGDYPARLFALDWPRELLYARIDLRVEQMIEAGLVGEVRALLDVGLPRSGTAMQAIGYKEIVAVLDGNITMGEAVAQIQQSTRNYAKRQLTWFGRDERVIWINAQGHSAAQIARQLMEDTIKCIG